MKELLARPETEFGLYFTLLPIGFGVVAGGSAYLAARRPAALPNIN